MNTIVLAVPTKTSFTFNGDTVVPCWTQVRVSFSRPTLVRGQRKPVTAVTWVFFPGSVGELCYKNPGRKYGYALSPDISHLITKMDVLK